MISSAREALQLVSELTGVPSGVLTVRVVDGTDAYLCVEPVRGGVRVIVGPDGQVLFAASSVPPGQFEDMYRSGRHTPLERFADLRRYKLAEYSRER